MEIREKHKKIFEKAENFNDAAIEKIIDLYYEEYKSGGISKEDLRTLIKWMEIYNTMRGKDWVYPKPIPKIDFKIRSEIHKEIAAMFKAKENLFMKKARGYWDTKFLIMSKIKDDKTLEYVRFYWNEDMDIETLKAIDHTYAKDKNKVYLRGMIIPKADPETFIPISHEEHYEFSKDASKVFLQQDIVEGANPETFELLDKEYSKDNENGFWRNLKIEGVDVVSFESLGNGFAKDKNRYYEINKALDEPPSEEYLKQIEDSIGNNYSMHPKEYENWIEGAKRKDLKSIQKLIDYHMDRRDYQEAGAWVIISEDFGGYGLDDFLEINRLESEFVYTFYEAAADMYEKGEDVKKDLGKAAELRQEADRLKLEAN